MQITAQWSLVIWFSFRILLAECVVSPWIYNSNNKKKKKKNLSIYLKRDHCLQLGKIFSAAATLKEWEQSLKSL